MLNIRFWKLKSIGSTHKWYYCKHFWLLISDTHCHISLRIYFLCFTWHINIHVKYILNTNLSIIPATQTSTTAFFITNQYVVIALWPHYWILHIVLYYSTSYRFLVELTFNYKSLMWIESIELLSLIINK